MRALVWERVRATLLLFTCYLSHLCSLFLFSYCSTFFQINCLKIILYLFFYLLAIILCCVILVIALAFIVYIFRLSVYFEVILYHFKCSIKILQQSNFISFPSLCAMVVYFIIICLQTELS